MKAFLKNLPKAELHVHLEGTMEPEQLLLFAERNNVAIAYKTVEQARAAYAFVDYRSFIDAYSTVMRVLKTEQDFYDVAMAYLDKMHQQGVLHTEISFDLQTYLPRGIEPEVIINGIYYALQDGWSKYKISSGMIMCFIRHLSEESALQALELSLPYKDKIVGVGLAALEPHNPPAKFIDVFAKAKQYGYRAVAHAEIGNTENIRQAIEYLHVDRIDHGTACMHDPTLVALLKQKQIPLTVCPLSNVALGIYKTLADHPLKKMIEAGLLVTINSDDPAFFDGYILDNYYAVQDALKLSRDQFILCARNSFVASFADEARKKECLRMLDEYVKTSQE